MMVTEERIGVPFVRNYEGVFANSVFVLFGLDYVKLLIVVVVADDDHDSGSHYCGVPVKEMAMIYWRSMHDPITAIIERLTELICWTLRHCWRCENYGNYIRGCQDDSNALTRGLSL